MAVLTLELSWALLALRNSSTDPRLRRQLDQAFPPPHPHPHRPPLDIERKGSERREEAKRKQAKQGKNNIQQLGFAGGHPPNY
jgi:hypothetical protein